jgi:alpha/beta superfamily hydrolase
MAIEARTILIEGPAGALETLLENFADAPRGIMVVCHPHPQHGGTLHNKVVHTLARSAHDLGLASLRFNYRGVGQSEGKYDEGRGETSDLLTVLDWLDDHFPAVPVWLAGFSFGAYVALEATNQRAVSQLITVAPAVNLLRFAGVASPICPWLLVMGTADEIVPFEQVLEWIEMQEHRPETLFLEGAGHFFHGRLVELRETLIGRLAGAAKKL